MYAKSKIVFILVILFVLSGCADVVATPEVQAVNAQHEAVVETDRIYDFIYVNDIPIGGLTKDEATKKLTDELFAPIENQRIIVSDGDRSWSLELNSLNYRYNIQRVVDEAYGYARTGDMEARYNRIAALENEPYKINIEPFYDKSPIDAFVDEIASEIYTPAVEPTIKREGGAPVVTPGSDGRQIDAAALKESILQHTDNREGGELSLIIVAVPPKFTAEDLKNNHAVIGTYSTPITGSASRDVNLTVASGYVNGVTLYPGEVFSTNKTIGPTTYDRGYRNAPVIVNGRLEDGIGGGVCQVSSTLYNAVLFSELEIVERRNHSLVVGYCPIGRDATLAGDVIDFKFKNDLDYPIYVESYLEGKKLFVNIYGQETRPAGRTVDFESVYVGSTPAPAAMEILDPSLPTGERVVTVESLAGSIVDVYKKIMIDGVVTEKIYVDRSTYRARAGEVRIGTGEAVPADETVAPPDTGTGVQPAPTEPVDNTVAPSWLGTDAPVSADVVPAADQLIDFSDLE